MGFVALAPARAQDSVLAAADNLVVDGGATKDSGAIAEKGRKIRFVPERQSGGLASNRRRAMLDCSAFCPRTPQLNLVHEPAARGGSDVFADSVTARRFHPNGGERTFYFEGYWRRGVVPAL